MESHDGGSSLPGWGYVPAPPAGPAPTAAVVGSPSEPPGPIPPIGGVAEREDHSAPGELAGLPSRAVAWVLDVVLAGIIMLVVFLGVVFFVARAGYTENVLLLIIEGAAVFGLPPAVAFIAVTLRAAKRGATPGMAVCGLRLVRSDDGYTLSRGGVALRWLVKWCLVVATGWWGLAASSVAFRGLLETSLGSTGLNSIGTADEIGPWQPTAFAGWVLLNLAWVTMGATGWWIAVDRRHQALHDKVLRSLVVRVR